MLNTGPNWTDLIHVQNCEDSTPSLFEHETYTNKDQDVPYSTVQMYPSILSYGHRLHNSPHDHLYNSFWLGESASKNIGRYSFQVIHISNVLYLIAFLHPVSSTTSGRSYSWPWKMAISPTKLQNSCAPKATIILLAVQRPDIISPKSEKLLEESGDCTLAGWWCKWAPKL